MSNISFCWELGGGYGHLASFKPLAAILLSRGHTVTAFLRETQYAAKFFDATSVEYSLAPFYRQTKGQTGPTISYPDILTRCGYHSTESLMSLVTQWRDKYQQCGTELIIADHSPTALLAARTLNIRSTMIGTGFFSPPPVYPLPSITPWLDSDKDFIKKIEAAVLDRLNTVLKHYAVDEIEFLHQLFDVDEDFLCTLPELDHYNNRDPEAYWGPLFSDSSGVDVNTLENAWPASNNKSKVFIYTTKGYKLLENLLLSLTRIDADFVVHCAGLDTAEITRYTADNICFSIKPVQIKSIKDKADLVVCHSGHGTIAASLLLGIPLLLIPMQLEQYLIASKLTHYKFANLIEMRDSSPDFVEKINSVVNNPQFKEQANRFALHYGGFNQQEQLEEVALACEDVLG